MNNSPNIADMMASKPTNPDLLSLAAGFTDNGILQARPQLHRALAEYLITEDQAVILHI